MNILPCLFLVRDIVIEFWYVFIFKGLFQEAGSLSYLNNFVSKKDRTGLFTSV